MRAGQSRHVYLIGFSGSGKSTVGPLLARRLKRRFIDVDARLEREFGTTIAAIFEQQGERFFRRAETMAIADLSESGRSAAVVAVGGGAFQTVVNRNLIRRRGVTVYLGCSVREICRRLADTEDRPLMQIRPRTGETARAALKRRVAALLEERKADYRRADITVSTTSKSPSRVVAEITRRLKAFYGNR